MPPSSPLASRLVEFFDQWGIDFETMCRSFDEYFAPDCIWENPGPQVTHGPREAVDKVIKSSNAGPLAVDTIRVEMVNIAEADGIVYTERIDHLVRADGTVTLSIPVAGVTEFGEDGRIQRWREYADVASVVKAAAKDAAKDATN